MSIVQKLTFEQTQPDSKYYEYAKGDPICEAYPNIKRYLDNVFGKTGSLTICANLNNDIVGFQEMESLTEWLGKTNTNVSGAEVMTQYIKTAEQIYKNYKSDIIEKTAHLSLIAVNPLYRNKGIGTVIVKEALKILKVKEFKSVVVECTGEYSAKVMINNGFKVLTEIYYDINIESPHTSFRILQKDI